ncbi:TPA: MBG domain-containing protein, partial [Pseudomonas aeruginosa]
MVRPDSQRGKRTSSKAGREGRFVLAASSTLMFAIASINAAMAAPTGAQFNPNEIKISQQGKTTLIDQSTQRAIINWKGFDVSADEAVRFNQPGVTSSTLNRVTAGQESVIAGRISAPGQVIIYNSNGVVFSGSAKVDVGSLITTTANISDEHFRQGKLIFDQPGNPDARIVNDGSISVAEKGLAAFVAPSVANNGVINARLGTVAMAAGNAATIDLYGDGLVSIAVTDPVTRKPQDAQALVSNGGAIQADGGSVLITAEQASRVVDNAVNLSGVILARGTEVREGSVALVSKSGDIQVAGKIDVSGPKSGGDVLVSGQQVALASTASIDARGAAQGGSVRIGGDFQGRGELPRAKNATLAKGASIDVSATGKGNGGLAVVWSDGNTRMDGRILARGGAQGGNGGLVTNLRYQVNGSNVTATPNGGAPSGFTVAAGNGSVTTWTGNWGTSWGVKGFGGVIGVTDELQYDVGTGLTEELIFGLGGKTSRVDTRLDLFMREGAFNSFAERAQVEMFKTTTTAGDILSRQQTATLTANDATRVYGDVNPTLTATMSGINAIDAYVNSQFNDLYQATASTTATQASNVGQYAITGNANGSEYFSQRYQLVRQDGKLTVTPAQLIVSADAKTKVYGDADPTLTYQVSGLKNSDTAAGVLSGNLGRVAGENVGNYGILQGGLGLNTANYTLSYVGNDLRITPAQLNVIADAKTKVYGDLDPALTYQVSGLKRGDTAGAVLNGGSLSRVAGENVGVYGINQGGLGLVSSNYTLNYQGNNLTITKALLNVIADAKTKVYGDADPALTYQVSGLKNGDTAGAVLNGGSLSRVAGENVGVYGINQGGLGLLSANYDLSYQGNNLTITKALLNVIADAKTKVYGDADPSLTYQVSGLKNGDTAGAVLNGGSLSRVAGENVGVYGINQGDLALNSGNYDLSYQGNNLTITKALLNVIADAKTKVYGDADPSLTYQVSGLKNGDTAGAVLNGGGLVRVSGENVGNYAIQQGGLGLVSGNYDLAYQGNNLTITKALLNVIADAKTKVYGDADPSLTYQVSGLKNGDTAGAVLNGGSLSRVAGENVGVYGINQGDLALNSGNYDLSYQGNNLTITKALLNVIADAKTKVYGDA